MRDIESLLPETEILAQLAEEASELAQAALKLRRAIDGKNPTPVSVEEAKKNLIEEYGDVLNCIGLVLCDGDRVKAFDLRSEKMLRWAERLEAASNG